jgi:hypothetical protein
MKASVFDYEYVSYGNANFGWTRCDIHNLSRWFVVNEEGSDDSLWEKGG